MKIVLAQKKWATLFYPGLTKVAGEVAFFIVGGSME